MSKEQYDPTKDPYEIARRSKVIERVFSPTAPLVKMVTVIEVSISQGDGSQERPGGHSVFYYTKEGKLIGEES